MDARSLLQAWQDAGGPPASSLTQDLSSVLAEAVRDARSTWPNLEVDPVEFVRTLALAVGAAGALRLPELNLAHLYLACACASGDPHAIAELETLCWPEVDAALSRFSKDRAFTEDIKQELREKLFVRGEGRQPRISAYQGRGSLARWVRVAAVRAAIDRVRGRGRLEDPASDGALLDRMDQTNDPEVRYLREKYSSEFKQAFEQAVGVLSDRERRLLREHIVFGLSTAQVGRLHGTSKATAARWIAAARARLVQAVHQALAQRLSVSASELRSIMKLVETDLQVSLSRIFESTSGSA